MHPKTTLALVAEVRKLRKVLREMKIYLDHGHGTSINSSSLFHKEMKAILKEHE
jgi:hypothetical protein